MTEADDRARDRVLDAHLRALGADTEFGYWPPLMELPSAALVSLKNTPILERRLPQQLLGIKTAKEALERGHAELEAKIVDFSSNVVEYNASVAIAEARLSSGGQESSRRRDIAHAVGNVSQMYDTLARKRVEIQLVQRNMARLTQGKRLVDEEEWWREYDDLWRQKLEIQQKLVNGSA